LGRKKHEIKTAKEKRKLKLSGEVTPRLQGARDGGRNNPGIRGKWVDVTRKKVDIGKNEGWGPSPNMGKVKKSWGEWVKRSQRERVVIGKKVRPKRQNRKNVTGKQKRGPFRCLINTVRERVNRGLRQNEFAGTPKKQNIETDGQRLAGKRVEEGGCREKQGHGIELFSRVRRSKRGGGGAVTTNRRTFWGGSVATKKTQ